MSITFTVEELFEMAQQLERNGAEFYVAAAMLPAAAARRRMLVELAAWEEQHEKLFADMQANQSAEPGPALTGEGALYMQALVNGRVFEPNAHELLSRCQTVQDVLRTAIGLEKESIVFYVGLRGAIAPEHRGRLEDIIGQEMRHVAVLTSELATMKAA
jgi:rubrerythrin